MDILLIDPPFTSLRGVSVDCGYNVGLTSLAAYLRRGGIETGIIMGLDGSDNHDFLCIHNHPIDFKKSSF